MADTVFEIMDICEEGQALVEEYLDLHGSLRISSAATALSYTPPSNGGGKWGQRTAQYANNTIRGSLDSTDSFKIESYDSSSPPPQIEGTITRTRQSAPPLVGTWTATNPF